MGGTRTTPGREVTCCNGSRKPECGRTGTSAVPICLAGCVPEPLGCVSSPLSLPGQDLVRQVSATSSPGGTSGRIVRTQDSRQTTRQQGWCPWEPV